MSTTEAVALVVAELDVVEPILSEADPVWAVGYVLGLRARANVALERRDAALRDILAGFRLVELMLQDPSEPNVGIANDILLSSAQSLWEAFSLKALTDSQFREIGDQLARIDFARALVAMMRMERANMVQWGPSFAQPTDR